MKKIFRKFYIIIGGSVLLSLSSCDNWLDVNTDPDNIKSAPISLQMSSLTTGTGFITGSDLNRYAGLLAQQYSGQTTGGETQTQQYEKYQISPTDANNAFSLLFATLLNSCENIITAAGTESPHYAGPAKLIKAYLYHIGVDVWGDLPYTDAQKLTANLSPNYDDDKEIYTKLLALIDEAIADLNASTSALSPGSDSQIYPGAFASSKDKWIKFANTLKLRLLIHYTEVDAGFATQQISSLVGSAKFFESNTDNFIVNFFTSVGQQNPMHQFEISRAGYLVANNTITTIMNGKQDPRRPFYFTQYPLGSGQYVGSIGGAPASQNYSKFNTYIRGALSGTAYSGAAPTRMLTFSEYNFIRAEAALRLGVTGNAEEFFQAGIRASMQDAGVSADEITKYITANGTLTGSNSDKLKQIIEEKFVANFAVAIEPWTDWRRTGYPAIQIPSNAVATSVPRSLFYPQSEDDNNRNFPGQKTSLDSRVFWDTRQ